MSPAPAITVSDRLALDSTTLSRKPSLDPAVTGGICPGSEGKTRVRRNAKRTLHREDRHWGETTVPRRHRRCAASHGQQRERQRGSASVPTLSQPLLRFNLC